MRKKTYFTALLAVVFLLFSGCGPAAPAQPSDSSGAKQEAPYVGTWLRQAIYTNGQLVSQVPSTLVITPTGTFFSINDYGFDEGTVTVTGDVMNTAVKSGLTPGQKVSHQFKISEDGQTMTFIIQASGVEMKEVYKRKQ
jgi:ABC-type oligopeptide transport system substrate-binding subunit